MTYGHYQRATARLKVLRGYIGNETNGLTFSAKPKANEAIKSGMVISLDSNGEWVKGAAAGAQPYFAYHDQSDTDVDSSGLLLGLSCSGDYELQTAHFVDAVGINVTDKPLKAASGGNAGKVEVGALDNTTDIIGFTSRGGRTDHAKINSSAKLDGSGKLYLVTLVTKWIPKHT